MGRVLGPWDVHFGKVSEALGRFWRGVEALGGPFGKGFEALGGPCGRVFRGPGRPIWGGFEGAGRHIWKRFGGGHSGDLSDLKFLKIIGKPWRALEILQDPQSSLPKEGELTLILGVSSRKPSRSPPRKSGVTGSLQHPPSSEFTPALLHPGLPGRPPHPRSSLPKPFQETWLAVSILRCTQVT